MNTWWEIITDPHHVLADIIMNTVYEVILLLVVYKLLYKQLYRKLRKKIENESETAHSLKISDEAETSLEQPATQIS